jgi:chorismate dehydratase
MVWRLGTVPYLNADPLTAALRQPDGALLVGDPVELSALVPAELIGALLRAEVDAALVSTAAVTPEPDLVLLPEGGCIASRGPVRSIQLYCARPPEEARVVALDASSRSAHALTRVLFAERWGRIPEFRTLPPDLPAMLGQADAALLIGNPALQANERLRAGDGPAAVRLTFDLGEVWTELTGLPFVYAAWAARPELDHARLGALLRRAKAWGLRRRSGLAARGAEALGLPPAVTLEYLTEAIRYDFGPAEIAGLRRFCELGRAHGVLPAQTALRLAPTDGTP